MVNALSAASNGVDGQEEKEEVEVEDIAALLNGRCAMEDRGAWAAIQAGQANIVGEEGSPCLPVGPGHCAPNKAARLALGGRRF
jgi:hypothetical protein